MKINKGIGFFLLLLAAAAAAVSQQATAEEFASSRGVSIHRSFAHPGNSRLRTAYGKLPLLFQANRGQTDSSVRFVSRSDGYSLFLTDDEAILSLRNWPTTGSATGSVPTGIRMKLRAASPAVKVGGAGEVNGESSYFIGNDPRRWIIGVPNYTQVNFQGIYPGVDLLYYGKGQQLEYDFVVAPGTDPASIILEFTGLDKLPLGVRINRHGDLVLGRHASHVRLHKPVVYQLIERQGKTSRKLLDARYRLSAGNRVSFDVPTFDHSRPLIIDPVLTYSTYLGGSGTDAGMTIAVDSAGNAYVAGTTNSLQFPTTASAYQQVYKGGSCSNFACGDAFVAKLDPTGSRLVYSTFFGGSAGDYARSLALDSSGNAYITGGTSSLDFPLVNPLQPTYGGGASDAFVAKLDSTGSTLLYSSYVGGGDADEGSGIAIDSSNQIYLTGNTQSANFAPSTAIGTCHGTQPDAFAAKMNAGLTSFVYKSCFGGSGADKASGIAVNSTGYAYLVGSTTSNDFPITTKAYQKLLKGPQNAFVTLLNPSGPGFYYSTLFGGNGADAATGVALEPGCCNMSSPFDYVYITGSTSSSNLPATAGIFQSAYRGAGDAFVAKLNAAGSGATSFVYATYLGGSGNDAALDIAVDNGKNLYVIGYTSSSDFPIANPVQSTYGGPADAFVVELNPSATNALYSTFLGGGGAEGSQPWAGIAVDKPGNVYVTGVTDSANFPVIAPTAFQSISSGGSEAFVSKLGLLSTPPNGLTLLWPQPTNVNAANLKQTYAEYNRASANRYHTGLDLYAPAGTPVGAAADGQVVLIQLNSPPNSPTCYDHVYGNTVIVKHSLSGGGNAYTQYSHMQAIDATIQQQCGTPDANYRMACSTPVPVSAQQTVGQVGYTTCGSSTTDVTKTHLHFELKNFSTLCAGGNDNGICAYTSPLPDQYGWFNPLDSLHPVANFATALPVSVNSNSQVPLLVGPGAFANTVYRTVLQANPGDKFDVVRSAAPTASPACSSAWYEVAKLDGSMFLDPKLNPGTIPTLWVCGDYVTPIGGAPAPSLTLSSSTVTFSATEGGTDPAPATVNVGATTSTLSFSASSDSTWLSVSPGSGSTPQSLQITATLGSRTAGTYTGHITVTAAAPNSPATITVTFTVAAPATSALSVNPMAVSFSAMQGGTDPAPATVNVSNTGSGSLSFGAASDSTWLSVSPSNGSAPQALQISAAVGALAAGTYTGHVTVTSAGAQGSPATVTVTFNVSPPPPPPTLSLSSTAVSLNGTVGSATNPSSIVTVSNSGSGTLNFDTSSDASWLSASPSSGAAPQNVQLTATVGTLAAGTYVGHITVTAAGAQNSPATITVTFVVSPPSSASPLAGFFVRGNSKSQNTASTTVASGWPASGQPQQNDLLIAYVWWNASTVAISSVSDNCGNVWIATPAQSDSIDNAQAQLFYVAGSKSCSSSPTVTVAFASAVSSRLLLGDWAGVGVGATYYDAGGTNFQAATTTPSASVTTSHASDLLIQVVAGNKSTDTFTAASGFTARQMGSGTALADQTVSASQTYSAGWTSNVADNHLVGIFGFQLTTAAAFPVQSVFNSVTASSISCTLPQRVSAGDLLVAVLRWPNDASVNMSVSDNLNGAWSPAGSQAFETVGPHSSQLFYLPNTSAGAVTVTASLSNGAAEALYIECSELTGMASANVLDGSPATGATSGTSTTISLNVGPVTTTNNNDVLVLACATDFGVKFVPDSGFINLQMQSREVLEFGSVTSQGSYSQACKSGAAHYTGALAAFRQAH